MKEPQNKNLNTDALNKWLGASQSLNLLDLASMLVIGTPTAKEKRA